MKKIFILITLLVLSLSLFSCKKDSEDLNTNIPMGNLSSTTYATLGDLSISEKEIYNLIRSSGYELFVEELSNALVAQKVSSSNVVEQDVLDAINEACYGTTKLDTLNDETKASYVKQFISNMQILGLTATEENIYTNSVVKYFTKTVMKTMYAKSLLTSSNSKYFYQNKYEMEDGKNLLDENDEKISNPYYVSEDDLKSYYNSNMKDDQEVKVVILGFTSMQDAILRFAEQGLTIDNTTGLVDYEELTDAEILEKYLAVYNATHQSNKTVDDLALDKESLNKYNSSLVKLINELEANEYTKRVEQISGTNYLVFKASDLDEVEYENLTEPEKQEVVNEKIDALVTTSVANSLVTELIEESDIVIYDPLFSKYFKAEHKDYEPLTNANWKAEYNNYVAKLNDAYLTVADFYNALEPVLGPTNAAGHFADSLLLKLHSDLITEDDLKEINNSIASTKSSFEEGTLTDYPTTLTEDEFNFVYYGANSSDEVVDKLKVQKIWNYLLSKYPDSLFNTYAPVEEAQGEEGEDETPEPELLSTGILVKYVEQYYENYFALSINHILISIDYDMDGSLDDPELLLNKFDDTEKEAFNNALNELANAILAEVNYFVNLEGVKADHLSAMQFVQKQFASSKDLFSDPTKNWADYKLYNFSVKVESLGSVSTSNASNYVKPFSNAVKELYKTLKAEGKESSKYLPLSVTLDDLVQTNYGYHILTSTGTTSLSSATYTSDKEYTITFNGVKETLSIKNSSKVPSNSQIKIFVAEMIESGSSSLNSTIQTCVKYGYTPFNTRFASTTFQSIYFMYNNVLNSISFSNSLNKEFLIKYYEVQKTIFDSYEDYSATSDKALAGWWSDFGCVIE